VFALETRGDLDGEGAHDKIRQDRALPSTIGEARFPQSMFIRRRDGVRSDSTGGGLLVRSGMSEKVCHLQATNGVPGQAAVTDTKLLSESSRQRSWRGNSSFETPALDDYQSCQQHQPVKAN
jgi:hypothetical protein